MTRSQPVLRNPESTLYDPSENCPDWFQIKKRDLVRNADITKTENFDGTVTLLSKITGWITVTPKRKNRSKRMGRYGPFDRSVKGNDLRNISDLAPQWMQNTAPRNPLTAYRKQAADPCLRENTKRVFLMDREQPLKNAFALGDFRHNVMGAEEARQHMEGVSVGPKSLLGWNADPFGSVTGKIN